MLKNIGKLIGAGRFGPRQWVYTFRILKPPVNRAVDDLVQDDLAQINTFVVADTTEGSDHLLILTTDDDGVDEGCIRRVLNDQFELDAEFVKKEKKSDKVNQ